MLSLLASLALGLSTGPIQIDTLALRVTTPHLSVRFEEYCPNRIAELVFPAWSASEDLAAEKGPVESHGQTLRGLHDPGHIVPQDLLTLSWTVAELAADHATILVETTSGGEPSVLSEFTFYADRPAMRVRRNLRFSAQAESSAVQPYVARIQPTQVNRRARWRQPSGAIVERMLCFGGCENADWDRRWLQYVGEAGPRKLGVTLHWPRRNPAGATAVRGYGLSSNGGWVGPLLPSAVRSTDLITDMLVVFSTAPDDIAATDADWAAFDGLAPVAAVESRPVTTPRVIAVPNPTTGVTRFAFGLARPDAVALELFDAGGRRLVTLVRGALPAGEHARTWDGRDAQGRRVAPGVVFARFTAGATTSVTRLTVAR